jgi:hypothetical protein
MRTTQPEHHRAATQVPRNSGHPLTRSQRHPDASLLPIGVGRQRNQLVSVRFNAFPEQVRRYRVRSRNRPQISRRRGGRSNKPAREDILYSVTAPGSAGHHEAPDSLGDADAPSAGANGHELTPSLLSLSDCRANLKCVVLL